MSTALLLPWLEFAACAALIAAAGPVLVRNGERTIHEINDSGRLSLDSV